MTDKLISFDLSALREAAGVKGDPSVPSSVLIPSSVAQLMQRISDRFGIIKEDASIKHLRDATEYAASLKDASRARVEELIRQRLHALGWSTKQAEEEAMRIVALVRAPSLDERCAHPERNGRHDVYAFKEKNRSGWHCRACGAKGYHE